MVRNIVSLWTGIVPRAAVLVGVLVLAVASLLAAATSARADHWSTESLPALDRSFRIAVRAWEPYLGHCVDSGIEIYGYDELERPEERDAYAFVPERGACAIYFNVDERRNYRRSWFCSLMVHEMGHVAGFGHSPDPHDIMNGPGEVYWRKCLTRREARRLSRRGKAIDYSIADWSGTSAATAGGDGHAERRPAGRVHAQRLAVIPVR